MEFQAAKIFNFHILQSLTDIAISHFFVTETQKLHLHFSRRETLK